ncbi:MAG: phage portal protein [Oscillospiraceae bacterium]|nr:phage portal protein [Oscillospiraceae bacterium]
MSLFDTLFRARHGPENSTNIDNVGLPKAAMQYGGGESAATKLAVVSRCIDLISDSVGKMNSECIESDSRKRVNVPVLQLLNVRPNEAMTPFVRRKMIEINRLVHGSGYDWVIRDPVSGEPQELIPLPAQLVQPWQDTSGRMWYDITHPYKGDVMRLRAEDVLHYKAYSSDGIHTVSVLRRAADVISAGLSAQQYSRSYYENGGQPAGVLETETDLGGYVRDKDGKPSGMTKKDYIRSEWERVHRGPDNAYRIAILDHGLKYHSVNVSMADAQWVENHDVTTTDICNFFGVPVYKVNSGKQSYSSNEQNAIEYVTATLHPIVAQYEQEMTYRLLLPRQRTAGLELRLNMMAELRGDFAARSMWYERMRNIGAYSVNDILRHEGMPDVDGGDARYASLNYVPLQDWAELSQARAQRGGGEYAEDT